MEWVDEFVWQKGKYHEYDGGELEGVDDFGVGEA